MRFGLIGCLGALILIIIIFGVWIVGVRNHLVVLDQSVQSQWAQVENDYQRRYDLIPNLVRTVQGAANFEKSTLEAVVNARSRVGQVQMPAGAPGTQSNTPTAVARRIVSDCRGPVVLRPIFNPPARNRVSSASTSRFSRTPLSNVAE